MADITKIETTNGTTYDIKDAGARQLISELQSYSDYLGVTSTELTDGATTNPVTIDGKQVTAVKGNIVNYGAKEYIFNGTAWQEFGDLSALGKLAYEDQATGEFTPAGTVSQPTFSGNEMTATGKFTPNGSVAAPTFTGSEGDVSVKGTPAGTISQPTFTGDALNSTGKFTPAGNVTVGVDAEGTANYTPEGTVSKPAVNVTPQTDTVNSIEDVGTLPSATMPTLETSVENETLKFSWTPGSFNAGTLPTKGSDKTVMTGASAELAAAPTFSGTGASLKATFAGTEGDVSVSGTPEGTVSTPTFTGSELTATGKFTPEGTNSAPAFTGSEGDVSVTGTPAGTVSQPTFTGTKGDVTVGAAD